MRRAGAVFAIVLLVVAAAALAQEAPQLMGTVTLRGGKALTGKIQLAELGVVEGAGIGNSLPGRGSLVLKVGTETVRVTGDEIASISVQWVNTGTEAEPRWEIQKVVVAKRDGSKVEGAPDWLLHATNVWVVTADGKAERVHVFPVGGEPFSPDNLIAKVELVGAAPPGQPAPVVPAAPSAPAAPAEEPEVEEVTPEAAAPMPTEPEAPEGTVIEVLRPPAAVAPAPAVRPVAPGEVVGQGTLSFVVKCPGCGQLLKVIISANAVTVEHLPTPAE
ncbi:MAG: hypothetical protein N2512_02055 [Armatimonadetes bacterium]|nr:hypothetical protein [Armatimonadota bacterium]